MKNWFMQATISIGKILIFGLLLQFYFVLFTLRGVIILGVFPALATCFKLIMRRLDQAADFSIEVTPRALWTEFRAFYQTSFFEINKIGYLALLPLFVLIIDFNINARLLGSFPIQLGLLLLLVLYADFLVYLFPVFVRYRLDFGNYFKQTLVVSVMNPKSLLLVTLMLVSLSLVFVIFPAIALFVFMPLYLWPITRITLSALQKLKSHDDDPPKESSKKTTHPRIMDQVCLLLPDRFCVAFRGLYLDLVPQ
ncbi:hypothetical protein FC15_GL001765 [Lapidilactobacillus concavus DSM 17758]|jgi:uncharacterized membrane protein YesL|uniref:Uncharacterized protein n=1 Tax=Lapidilactobacillus concavus DSM 17758 TaxID=1423735 RepID=A0A0R1VZ12_9LACO|nr:DUF624 domain-containing protein [Lapidilactobacillus concavus]KRM09115.1 hypothetical protein FC15_GL001765 [Lapidilactobacillus concavus DSM 17758]GEL13741.1 hypothetical protein LCO01nite_12900 [Lapidilactobacillus concavus]